MLALEATRPDPTDDTPRVAPIRRDPTALASRRQDVARDRYWSGIGRSPSLAPVHLCRARARRNVVRGRRSQNRREWHCAERTGRELRTTGSVRSRLCIRGSGAHRGRPRSPCQLAPTCPAGRLAAPERSRWSTPIRTDGRQGRALSPLRPKRSRRMSLRVRPRRDRDRGVRIPLGYALEAGRNLYARRATTGGSFAERTSASGRWLQPPESAARLLQVASAPFCYAQRPFGRTGLGTGLVARGRKPDY